MRMRMIRILGERGRADANENHPYLRAVRIKNRARIGRFSNWHENFPARTGPILALRRICYMGVNTYQILLTLPLTRVYWESWQPHKTTQPTNHGVTSCLNQN